MYQEFTFLSQLKVRSFTFQSSRFHCLGFPKKLYEQGKINFDVQTIDRLGLNIKVTSLERTIVDVLDRPEYAGGWEEIWRCAENIPVLNLEKMVEYTFSLANATTIAKVGFFLEQHKQQFSVDESILELLETKKPSNALYLERVKRESGKLITRWNLMVPTSILERSWEEPNNDAF